jgi:uncharacterized protein YndB with AHSA1/START domain
MKEPLPTVERSLVIGAPPEIVFRYFTDSRRFAAWWGAGSEIDCRPGGGVRIRYPDGTVASGEVVEADPPRRIVFTYGYEGEGKPIPPGGSRVTVELAPVAGGTHLSLRHEVPTEAIRDQHEQGWRYQLSVFANVVANEVHADAGSRIDAFFEAWSETDDARRRAALEAAASPGVSFRDAFSCVVGLADLEPHLAAAQRFMPGMTLARTGEVRQCQGTAIADWIARGPDGAERGRGVNVFDFGPDGRITRVVGFWGS